MFFHYLKIGFRFLRKYSAFGFINILGLAMGLSAFLLMSLFVIDELSYDKFHTKGENIVRIGYRLETPNATRFGAKVPFPVKHELMEDYPEVKKVGRFYFWGGDTPLLQYGEQKFTEPGIYFSESSAFEVFDFEWVMGDPNTALDDPRSIVLTERIATKYFGNENPMGKIMRYKNEDDLIVRGVLKDIPDNSHIMFDILVPIELQRQRWMGWGQFTYDLEKDWNWAASWVYAELLPNTDKTEFTQKIQAIAEEHFNTENQDGFSIVTTPLYDIHLKSDMNAEARPNGNMTQVYSFAGIALLILAIACINFINLNTAQMNKRIKEVGMRKVMGARKKQLIHQFLAESLAIVGIATILGGVLVALTLPYFNQFTGKAIQIGSNNVTFLMWMVLLVIAIAILASLRPIAYIVGINAQSGLSSRISSTRPKRRFNRALVVVQFMVSNLLIVGILVIQNQLEFIKNKDLGFAKDNVITLRHGRNMTNEQFDIFSNDMKALPSIQALNRGYIAGTSSFTNTFKKVGDESESSYSLGIKWVGSDFLSMFDLKVVAGRDFDETSQTDMANGILINESAAKALGWDKESSVNQELSFLPGGATNPETIRVIGVIADANFRSLYDPVLPSVFRRTSDSQGSEISIRLTNSGDISNTLQAMEESWEKVIPDWPFEYSFLDETIQSQYVKEERLSESILYFAVLAIFIACLGLYGLASFSVQERTKEIGIRKVVGASVRAIVLLVSKRFFVLIGISLVASIPIGYYLFDQWLQNFAYRIPIGIGIFLMAALTSIVVAIVAIGTQSSKAATINPVKTLRYE